MYRQRQKTVILIIVLLMAIIGYGIWLTLPSTQKNQDESALKKECGTPGIIIITFQPDTTAERKKEIISQEKLPLHRAYDSVSSYAVKSTASLQSVSQQLIDYVEILTIRDNSCNAIETTY